MRISMQAAASQLAVASVVVAGLMGTQAHAQRVVRDAETGQLRQPTAAEIRQLESLNKTSRTAGQRGVITGTLNPKPVRMPDGSDYLESTEADMNYSVVVRMADGRLARQCVANAAMAERIARGDVVSFTKNMQERLNER